MYTVEVRLYFIMNLHTSIGPNRQEPEQLICKYSN